MRHEAKSNDHMMCRKCPKSRARRICWVNIAFTISGSVDHDQITMDAEEEESIVGVESLEAVRPEVDY